MGTTGQDLFHWQREALAAWRAADRVGMVEAVTGTGKTRLAIEAIRECLAHGGRALVIVPTVDLVEQWARQLKASLPEHARVKRYDEGAQGAMLSLGSIDVLVSTVHTASRGIELPDVPALLLIADECHRYGAPNFAQALSPRFERRLGLSATVERTDEGDALLASYFRGEPVYRIGFPEAISQQIVAPFRLALVGVRLDADEQARYENLSEQMTRTREQLVSAGLPAEPRDFLDAVVITAKKDVHPHVALARRFISLQNGRRELLESCGGKVAALSKLAGCFRTSRGALVFTMRQSSSERCAVELAHHGLRAAALHGNVDRSERRARLTAFGRGELDAICAPMVLDEGVDVPEADLAVIVAASSSRRQMIQRMGRVLRRKPDRRHASMVILFAENSVEDPDGPARAHETFLHEASSAATAWRRFSADTDAGTIGAFLSGASPGEAPRDVATQVIPPPRSARPPAGDEERTSNRARGPLELLLERGLSPWSAARNDERTIVVGSPEAVQQLLAVIVLCDPDGPTGALASQAQLLTEDTGAMQVAWRIRPGVGTVHPVARLALPDELFSAVVACSRADVRSLLARAEAGQKAFEQEFNDPDALHLARRIAEGRVTTQEVTTALAACGITDIDADVDIGPGVPRNAVIAAAILSHWSAEHHGTLPDEDLAAVVADFCAVVERLGNKPRTAPDRTRSLTTRTLQTGLGRLRRALFEDGAVDATFFWGDIAAIHDSADHLTNRVSVAPPTRPEILSQSHSDEGNGENDRPRRDIGAHIISAFTSVPAGTFLTIAQIQRHRSQEYGDDTPSGGAISNRLFPPNNTPCTVPGIQPAIKDGRRGAIRGSQGFDPKGGSL